MFDDMAVFSLKKGHPSLTFRVAFCVKICYYYDVSDNGIDNGNDNGSIMHKKWATRKEVASAARVSKQAVSGIVNKRLDVSPEAQKFVLEVVNRLGSRPSTFRYGLFASVILSLE